MDTQTTLTAEHAHLLTQITDRARRVLQIASHDRWPRRELTTLARYLRAELIRQLTDEERLLFPAHEATPELSRLARDHARLRACVDTIATAARGRGTRSPAQIATTVRDLLTLLHNHLATEQATLTGSGRPTISTAALGAFPHRWYPLTEGPTIDLDVLPADRLLEAVSERLHRLPRGEHLDLCSHTDPDKLCHALAAGEDDYGFAYLACGPDQWQVRVTRRLER
ncbi:hemerythrin domain-containing protein [Nonomuraea sp. NPDC048892]|uniref:hemerythrin domain-containing protein n=1 Tax=Nonomuraea sp. NPDC048892 TaxID=3154624 RepID=UPI00341058FE